MQAASYCCVGAQGLATPHLCPDAQRALSLRLQQPLLELLHLAVDIALRGAQFPVHGRLEGSKMPVEPLLEFLVRVARAPRGSARAAFPEGTEPECVEISIPLRFNRASHRPSFRVCHQISPRRRILVAAATGEAGPSLQQSLRRQEPSSTAHARDVLEPWAELHPDPLRARREQEERRRQVARRVPGGVSRRGFELGQL